MKEPVIIGLYLKELPEMEDINGYRRCGLYKENQSLINH